MLQQHRLPLQESASLTVVVETLREEQCGNCLPCTVGRVPGEFPAQVPSTECRQKTASGLWYFAISSFIVATLVL